MKLNKVEFLTSAADPSSLPKLNYPAVAFAGRSNVGKSSLINTILNRKNFARTSNSPGKTRLINYYTVNDALNLVDLPGYGYAKVSFKMRKKWQQLIEHFLSNCDSLKLVLLIIDVRRGFMEQDAELLEWLLFNNLELQIVITKSDKISKQKAIKIKQDIILQNNLHNEPILFSAVKIRGVTEIWSSIKTATS